MSILTTMQLLPLVGAAILAVMPAGNSKLIKQIALGFALLVTAVSIVMAFGFDTNNSALQFTETRSWISAFNRHRWHGTCTYLDDNNSGSNCFPCWLE
jgi:NADH-quinone oxidoreductase subunit M